MADEYSDILMCILTRHCLNLKSELTFCPRAKNSSYVLKESDRACSQKETMPSISFLTSTYKNSFQNGTTTWTRLYWDSLAKPVDSINTQRRYFCFWAGEQRLDEVCIDSALYPLKLVVVNNQHWKLEFEPAKNITVLRKTGGAVSCRLLKAPAPSARKGYWWYFRCSKYCRFLLLKKQKRI